MNFLTTQQLDQNLTQYKELLEKKIDETNGDLVAQHLSELTSWYSFGASLEAAAMYHHQNDKKNPERRAVLVLAQKLNSACSNRNKGMMTILSRIKVERQMTTFGG